MSAIDAFGFITQIKDKFVTVKVSDKALSKMIDKSTIKFRGSPAPPSLITVNSRLILKLNQNNIIEASIDPKIDLNAFFGFIKQVDTLSQTVTISNSFEMWDCPYTQVLFANGQQVPFAEVHNKINYPVIAYLNAESFLEARIISEDNTFKLNLDAFRAKQGIEETMFISMKDDRYIVHHIISTSVFFKYTDENPSVDAVKQLLAKEVTVFIKNGKVRAEINSSPINQSGRKTEKYEPPPPIQQEIKKTEFDYDYNNEDINLKSFTCNAKKNIHDFNSVKEETKSKTDEHYTASYSANRSSANIENRHNPYSTTPINYPKDITPVYALRHRFDNFFGSNLAWFYKQNQQSSTPQWIIFIGLCESAFRFPQSYLRKILKQKLTEASISFGQTNYESSFEWLVSFGDKKREGQSIEDLHSYLNQSSEFFKYYANHIIGEINFETLAEEYRVCFNIYKGESNNPENLLSQPYTFEPFFPVISLYYSTDYYLIYSNLVMKYDGFNLMTLRLDAQNDATLDWPLIYKPEEIKEVIPDNIKLLQYIAELQEHILNSRNYNEDSLKITNNELVSVLENLKSTLNPKDDQKFIEYLGKIKTNAGIH